MPSRPLLRLRRKTSRKTLKVASGNGKRKVRRNAVHASNVLISDLGLPVPKLGKRVDMQVPTNILRFMSKRCQGGTESARLGAALKGYTGHGGQLPEGMEFLAMGRA